MHRLGPLVKRRVEQVIVENDMLRAGFAALPYLVLKDTKLSVGARLSYAVLLMYAWQEGATFAGQLKMAADVGVSERQLRRYLDELQELKYIRIQQRGLTKPNIYYILDAKTKLRKVKSQADRTPVSGQERTGAAGQERTYRSD